MNHRRALRAATDAGLTIFLIMIVGVILWTSDEVLNWNILPDWVDKYAQLLLIILSILAGFAVVISVMCSIAVLAESAAEKAGLSSPPPSRRARRLITLGILLFLVSMFCLHKIDQHRASKRQQQEQERVLARYSEIQRDLQGRMKGIAALFSAETRQSLLRNVPDAGDESLARLLNAVRLSTPFDPEVDLMVRANAPYRYCTITAVSEKRNYPQEGSRLFLERQFLTDFPSAWERDTIEALFDGRALTVSKDKPGVFINTQKPSTWDFLTHDNKVIAIVMLRGSP